MQIGPVELGKTGDAKQPEAPHHLVLKQLQHPDDPILACRGQRPALQAADADEIGA